MVNFKFSHQAAIIALATTSLLQGCSYINKTGANIALGFAGNHIVPPIMAMDDTDMACASGNSMTPAIMATKAMGANPTNLAVLLYASAGMCAETSALEAELRYMRASKAGNVPEAQDARIEQKRWAALAAKRQYTSYQLFAETWENKYKFKLGESCPSMKKDLDKTVYMLGLLSGLQAVTNDISSGGQINVPKDIAAVVERSMKCLDNNQYWGVPNATRAVIWNLLPGAGDGKPDAQQTLRDAMALGEKQGVRLPHAMYAVSAQASGDPAKIRDALRAYGASIGEGKPVNPNYRLLNAMAGIMVRNVADRYWTENTGVRLADDAGLSHFWDDKADDGLGDLGIDLLDDKPATDTPTSTDKATETPQADSKPASDTTTAKQP